MVGYGAMAFLKRAKPAKEELDLDKNQKTALLAAARESIRGAFSGIGLEPAPLSGTPLFNLPLPVFVTLKENGRLRGCIGTTAPGAPLLDAVRYYSRLAAFSDPRFSPLAPPELDSVKIEISILSNPAPVASDAQITPGKDGVLVRRGNSSGLFLPQVWKDLPDKKAFLDELCTQKAGLEKGCWKDGKTALYTFTDYAFED